MLKVSIESSTIATEYDDITVDPGFPILKDMVFDEEEQYLYVLSPNKVGNIRPLQLIDLSVSVLTCPSS